MPTAPAESTPPPHLAADRPWAAGWAWLAAAGIGAVLLPPEAWLRSIVLAPWLEEAVLRWGVQAPLQARWHRPGKAPSAAPAWVAALLFAALHMAFSTGAAELLRAAGTLLPAWWIGRAYQSNPRLLPCVAWHAGFNLLWLAGLSRWLMG